MATPGIAVSVVIVGAGPAGLAVGACLQRAGVEFTILERAATVGSAWRKHYERLHLHSSKGLSELPYRRYPKAYPRYPSRDQVIAYLDDYAQHFQLKPQFGQCVSKARPQDGGWEIQTQDRNYRADRLVVATSYNNEPHRPTWPGQQDFRGTILHSDDYMNGEPFAGQRVLVVGFGNSGGEIAIDLHEHGARPSLAVRSPVNVIPRDLFGIPILAIGILESRLPPRLVDAMNAPILHAVIGDLRKCGLRQAPFGPIAQIKDNARIPLIDVGTVDLIKRGDVTVYPGIEHLTADGVAFDNGHREPFDALVLATGYHVRVDRFLHGAAAALDAHGTPTTSGCESPTPSLYFCGYRVAPSGGLREIALEAQRITADIARKQTAPPLARAQAIG
jgi:indole-3-pyruvate monooxygenase